MNFNKSPKNWASKPDSRSSILFLWISLSWTRPQNTSLEAFCDYCAKKQHECTLMKSKIQLTYMCYYNPHLLYFLSHFWRSFQGGFSENPDLQEWFVIKSGLRWSVYGTQRYGDLKSVNLQYITLGCLDDGTNESSTKSLIFQVLYFSMLLIDLGYSKLFILIFVIL